MPNLWYSQVHFFGSGARESSLLLLYTDSFVWCDHGYTPESHREIQREFVNTTLMTAKENADWIVVVGHYPVLSSGSHGDQACLVTDLEPALHAAGVDAYVNGHDHHQELLTRVSLEHQTAPGNITKSTPRPGSPPPVNFVIAGTGSKTDRNERKHAHRQWRNNDHGFAAFTFSPSTDTMRIRWYGQKGQILHEHAQKKRERRKSAGGGKQWVDALPEFHRVTITFQKPAIFRFGVFLACTSFGRVALLILISFYFGIFILARGAAKLLQKKSTERMSALTESVRSPKAKVLKAG